MKNFLREYLYEYKPNRLYFRCKEDSQFAGTVIAFLMVIMFFLYDFLIKKEDFIVLLLLSPCYLCVFSIAIHGMGREKMFYLIPFSSEERKHKLRDDYIKRILIHLIMFAICGIALKLCLHIRLLSIIAISVIDFVLSTMISFNNGEKGYTRCVLITIILIMIMLGETEIATYPNHLIWQDILIYGIIIGIVLPIYISYQKVIAALIDNTGNYMEARDESSN